MSHVNSAGRVGALLGLTDPAASGGDLPNGGSTVTSTSVPDHVGGTHRKGIAHRAAYDLMCWPAPTDLTAALQHGNSDPEVA